MDAALRALGLLVAVVATATTTRLALLDGPRDAAWTTLAALGALQAAVGALLVFMPDIRRWLHAQRDARIPQEAT